MNALVDMLKTNHRMKLLNLGHTDITAADGERLAAAVEGHVGLHTLELHDTKVGEKQRAQIEARLEANRKAHAAEEAAESKAEPANRASEL